MPKYFLKGKTSHFNSNKLKSERQKPERQKIDQKFFLKSI
jgi:hypothetical protein